MKRVIGLVFGAIAGIILCVVGIEMDRHASGLHGPNVTWNQEDLAFVFLYGILGAFIGIVVQSGLFDHSLISPNDSP